MLKPPLFLMKIQYDFFFVFVLERLGRMYENKKKLFLYFFIFVLRKPGILISDLYLYSIKIQININR